MKDESAVLLRSYETTKYNKPQYILADINIYFLSPYTFLC